MAGPSSPSPILERGRACLRCRRRKMRCDGMRPACGQCARSNIEDCEYTEGGPTVSQVLEQNIADLEARIRQLEGGDAAVVLHDPRAAPSQNYPASNRTSPSLVPTTQRVIQSFVDHASSFGFFLHVDRFLVSLRASIPPTDHSPVPAALVHVVYLLGVVFSNDPVLKQQESQILTRAFQSLTPALDPARIIYALQAEVLLSNYLFHKGRVFEGGYHSAAAVSIAVACRLHKLRSAVWPAVTANAEFSLPAPRDDVEEGERTMAFWNVFVLDRCWATFLQSSSVLIQEASANMQIDTPWPLKMANYEQHLMPQGNTGAQTVQKFLRGLTTESPYQSLLALRAKASILHERASRIAASWDHNSPNSHAQLQALDTRIDQFIQTLPRLEGSLDPTRIERTRDLLVIHTLCYCATLQLHSPRDYPLDANNSKSLLAANAAADILQVVDVSRLRFVDPIMGVLWGLIGRVLVAGLTALKHANTSTISPTIAVSPAEIIVTASLNRVLEAMYALAETSPLIGEELNKLRASIPGN